MRRPVLSLSALLSFFLLIIGTGWAGELFDISRPLPSLTGVASAASPADRARVNEAYGKLPLYFIKNNGQLDKKVKYYERGGAHATFFTKEGVYLSLTKAKGPSAVKMRGQKDEPFVSEVVKLSLVNSSKALKITALEEQEGRINYLIGADSSKWRTGVPTFKAVLYKDVYKGIDIKYYGNNRQLEYDIVVKPGADPRDVKFAYEGVKGIKLTEEGDLEIALYEGRIIQKRPYIYQEVDGKRVEVGGRFVISPEKEIASKGDEKFSYGFQIASYDKKRDLVIDPYIVYSTYLGGSGDEGGNDIAIDSSGNAYIIGTTNSSDFPTAFWIQGSNSGSVDAFVTKINASGTAIAYSTYIGGSGADYGYSIAVDPSGYAYIAGKTFSTNFPTFFPIQPANDGTAAPAVTAVTWASKGTSTTSSART